MNVEVYMNNKVEKDNCDAITRCGYVAVLGLPNVGKSTLINQVVGCKVSIVSPKVQTTRDRILGIAMHKSSQIILIDTPGIFAPQRKLDKVMVDVAWNAGKESDINLLMVDVNNPNLTKVFAVIERLSPATPVFLVFNKVDTIKREILLDLATKFQSFPVIKKVFMISALKKSGVKDLVDTISTTLPEGSWLYPEDQLTDLPQRIWASEITREQLYWQLQHELPYTAYVESETWEELEDGSVKIRQVIVASKDSQKGIILGKNGARIKNIGRKARLEMEKLLQRKVHLILFVKIEEDWVEKSTRYYR